LEDFSERSGLPESHYCSKNNMRLSVPMGIIMTESNFVFLKIDQTFFGNKTIQGARKQKQLTKNQ